MKTVLLAALTGLAVATTSLVFAQSAEEPQDTDAPTAPAEPPTSGGRGGRT